jgi:Flp pilus assembly protein TadG
MSHRPPNQSFWSAQGRGGEGQAMIEFALAFPLQLFLTFGIMQLILIYVSTLLVNFAAYRACRAAVVVLPDPDSGMDPDQQAAALRLDWWFQETIDSSGVST